MFWWQSLNQQTQGSRFWRIRIYDASRASATKRDVYAGIRKLQKPVLLYTSADIHAHIKRLFGDPSFGDRRVALVAYVGADGERYLPHPKGLRMICNPSAGGTDPDTLRSLIKNGASVEVSDGLHMKVYWSKNRGCIITSANASSNALGKDGLKEAGIWLPRGSLNIGRLIRYANPRTIRESDLHRLDAESRVLAKNIGNLRSRGQSLNFAGWYTSPHRSNWKVGVVMEQISGISKAAKEKSAAEYGHKEPYSWVSCREGTVNKNNWILTFVAGGRGITSISWIYADFIVKVSRKEERYYDRAYPHHAVQVNPPSKYPAPPFKITPRFRIALRAAVREYSSDKILAARTDMPPQRLLRLIERHYLAAP